MQQELLYMSCKLSFTSCDHWESKQKRERPTRTRLLVDTTMAETASQHSPVRVQKGSTN